MSQSSGQLSKDDHSAPGRYSPLVVIAIAMGGGILAGRYFSLPCVVWWVGAWIGLAAWGAASVWGRHHSRVSVVALLLAVAAASGAWMHSRWTIFQANEIGRAATEISQPICLEVKALTAPRRIDAPPANPMRTIPRIDRSVLPVSVISVRNGRSWCEASGRAELTVDGHLLGIEAGDRIRVYCQFSSLGAPVTPGAFDFAAHRRGERILCRLRCGYPDCVERLDRGSPWKFRPGVDTIRRSAGTQLDQFVAPDQSALAAAILIGERKGVGREEVDLFIKTGLIHLLALSGLHVGMLALLVTLASDAGLLSRHKALLLVVGIAIGYAILADVRPSVVRAATLLCLICAGGLLRRPTEPLQRLAAAAMVVLAFQPADLFNVGFQLSFIASATLLAYQEGIRRVRSKDPLAKLIAGSRPRFQRAVRRIFFWFAQLAGAGVCVWLVALPLVAYRFHIVAPVGTLLNPILWLPMAMALATGFLTIFVGWLVPPLAPIPGAVCSGSLSVLQQGVTWGSDLPGSHFWTSGPAGGWVLGFYLLLALWLVLPRWRPPRRWTLAISLVYLALGATAAPGRLPTRGSDDSLKCTFVSVGHGICAVLELPDGKTLMYDVGRLGSPQGGVREVSAYLWSRGITHVDAVVLSHADADHYNMLPRLLERFSVGIVYVSPVMFEEESPSLLFLRQAIQQAEVPMRQIHAGDQLRTDGSYEMEILHPPRRGVLGSDNANSIVLAVRYEGRRLLLTGDLESPGLEDVLAERPLDCDVVLAPHHGSAGSNPVGFAAWSSPEWVVISGGRGVHVPGLVSAFEAEHRRVLHTALHGTIQIEMNRASIHASTFREARE